MTSLVHDKVAIPRGDGVRTAVVMTMGALHAGHVALMQQGRALVGPAGRVIATVFVNPRQFGAGEDFDRYPRTLEADVSACASAGVDVVFAPDVDEVYPPSGTRAADICIDPGPLGAILEGAVRPGHFSGMLTVVAKLLQMTQPQVALFGEKDYQQLVAIRAMVRALDFPCDVVGVPTVREPDGLALSSRNRYLSPPARAFATAISAALHAGQSQQARGAAAVRGAAAEHLEQAMVSSGLDVSLDYLVVTDEDLGEPPAHGNGRLLVAVRVEGTRLIDNLPVTLG